MADALGQVAVTGDHEGVVVADVGAEAGAEPSFGQAHADAVGEALAQRTGGDLDAGGVVDLGVPGGAAAPLPEGLQVVEASAPGR